MMGTILFSVVDVVERCVASWAFNGLETHRSDAGLLAFDGMTMAPLLER
jgi:hypothetical protein